MWIRAGAAGVVIAGRRKDVLDKTVTSLEGISNGTKVLGVQTDIRVENDAQNLFAKVTAVFGRPADVVLANAGLVTKLKPFAEEKIDTWWNVLVRSPGRNGLRRIFANDVIRRSISRAYTTPLSDLSGVNLIPKILLVPSST